jgi:hypothetical protein
MPATASVQIKVFGDVQFSRKLMRAGFRAPRLLSPSWSRSPSSSRGSPKNSSRVKGLAPASRGSRSLRRPSRGRASSDDLGRLGRAARLLPVRTDEDNVWTVTNDFLRWGSD